MSGGAGRTAGRRGTASESTAHLPDEQRRALRSAVRLEWFSIGYTCVALLVVGVVAGAVFGIVLAAVPYGMQQGRRDFASTTEIVAQRYDILCDPKTAEKARNILARRNL